jgi:hypothetical protein
MQKLMYKEQMYSENENKMHTVLNQANQVLGVGLTTPPRKNTLLRYLKKQQPDRPI